jgi:hypothetical protein
MKYRVEITRTAYSTQVFEVEAEDYDQAEELALDEAYDTDFEEDYADYHIRGIHKAI